MASSFEAIPYDILQHIALLVATESPPSLDASHSILTLLLTSSTLHRLLCIRSCPHLYADIFRVKFDVRAIPRRFNFQVTDTALTSELVIRCQMLRRVRRRCFSSFGELRQDLWTAFWMIQESDGLNELQLRHAGLAEYVLDVVHSWDEKVPLHGSALESETRSLVIWLLCYTLTQHPEHILSSSPDTRNILHSLLLPYSRNVHRSPPSAINANFLLLSVPRDDHIDGINDTTHTPTQLAQRESRTHHHHQLGYERHTVVIYAREWVPQCPDPNSAAINLIFCLKEIEPMAVPEHLPETRSIAIATQRFGPTKEDIRKIRGYRTKLFADTIPSLRTHSCPLRRSEWHDLESRRMVWSGEGVATARPLSTMPGMLTGIWEGFYLIAGTFIPTPERVGYESHHAIPDFICRKPMQSVFSEFVCYSSGDANVRVPNDMAGLRDLPNLSPETERGFEIDGRKYERFISHSDPDRQRLERELGEPLDIVLLGETLEDYEQAWGGFRYAGRIRTDGTIILKREPKETGDDSLSGTWIFEGTLRFGTVFVGNWSSSTSSMSSVPCVQGIFSMQKRANA